MYDLDTRQRRRLRRVVAASAGSSSQSVVPLDGELPADVAVCLHELREEVLQCFAACDDVGCVERFPEALQVALREACALLLGFGEPRDLFPGP
nr:MAG TPA: hypothetical protein [Caudoviricetes sp.]